MSRAIVILSLSLMLSSSVFATDTSIPFIHADEVHNQGFTGQGITVAVIDTGIYSNHPGLAGSIAAGGTSFEGGERVNDGGRDIYDDGHGTYMSLIITDATGVAPDSQVLPIRVLGPSGSTDDVILGIEYATLLAESDPSIRVINLSLSGGSYSCPCDFDSDITVAYQTAISEALGKGIVTFAVSPSGEPKLWNSLPGLGHVETPGIMPGRSGRPPLWWLRLSRARSAP